MSKSTASSSRTRSKSSSTGTRKKSPSRKKTGRSPRFSAMHTALRCLYDRIDVERTRAMRLQPDLLKLDRMRALMSELGDPHTGFRSVHIAGSKGKGSVCAMLDASLSACGYAVGVYTSPHLIDVRERMQVAGQMISESDFIRLVGKVEGAGRAIETKHGKPTFFEMVTAMAFCWFADQAVDIAIIETGLGGRLDATNVVEPDVAAITQISRDHTQLLGDTLPEIAREKAGIMKPGAGALTVSQESGVVEAMREIAEQQGVKLEVVGKDVDFSYRFEATPALGPHTCVCLTTPRTSFEHVNVPLPGEHQALNCGLALAIIDKLRERGFEAPENDVIAGLENTVLPGRMELMSRDPRILLDGAHNDASLRALMRSVGVHVPYDSLVVIFGCGEDKDVDELLRCVATGADKLIFTRARNNPRAVEPRELQQRFAEISGKMTQIASDLEEAMQIALRAVSRGDLICITGSFFLVGEAKKLLAVKPEAEPVGA